VLIYDIIGAKLHHCHDKELRIEQRQTKKRAPIELKGIKIPHNLIRFNYHTEEDKACVMMQTWNSIMMFDKEPDCEEFTETYVDDEVAPIQNVRVDNHNSRQIWFYVKHEGQDSYIKAAVFGSKVPQEI
jgi:hypothetical protein